MIPFAKHLGTWHGTNDFRLMPTDPFHTAPAGATVLRAAGGNLATITYNWAHPEDGEQSGQLVVGPGEEEGAVVGFWGDSWHQHPSPRMLLGTVENDVVTVGYEYAEGWWWRIIVDLTDQAALHLRMDNVVPEAAGDATFTGGAYSAMVTSLTRSAS
ncbi:MAG TPA: hypothetical protein VFT01_05100 [Homoserinimonas sp.]|nr:hypothetical protein [Homoserinimonas sp.]